MTEKLRNLMDEVTGMVDHDFASPDVDAITAAGDRVVRRRRVAGGVAGLAAVAVIATGAALLADGDRDAKAGFADDPFRTDVPMWTEGSVLHTPTGTYDLGIEVRQLTRTTDEIAYVGSDSGVYSFDGSASKRIGTIAGEDSETSVLVGDADGTRVGWVDATGGEGEFVVHDLATGDELRDPVIVDPSAEEPLPTGLFMAVDGTTAYWIDARGTTVTDVATGDTTRLGTPDEPVLVIDAEAGTTVTWVEDRQGGDLGTDVLGPDGQQLLGYEQVGSVGALSPGGRWAASLDDALVWDVRTGAATPLEVRTTRDAIGYGWLDAETLMVLTELEGDDDHIGLARCTVTSGDCADVAVVDLSGGPVALPSFGLMPLFSFGATTQSQEASSEALPTSSTERPE